MKTTVKAMENAIRGIQSTSTYENLLLSRLRAAKEKGVILKTK
jgi:ribosomal protein S20